MTFFLQQLISGISIGAIYSLLAVGYALVYSVYNFTNWAFDAFMVTGAFAAFYAISLFFMPFWMAMVFSILVTSGLALTTEVVAYRPLRARQAPRLFMMISAMGASMAVVNIANLAFGGAFRKFPQVAEGSIRWGGVSIGRMDLFAAMFSFVVLALLWYFLERTKLGLGVRASALDMVTAGIMGINNNRIAVIIFGISGVLSAVAGVFYGVKYAVYPYLGMVTIKAMIGSIIGGIGSLAGAVIGSLLLGVIETLISCYVSSVYRDLISFTILVVVLLFFPSGLMGTKTVDKL
ncbi:MAG TPA: branched-chain amino acid ABC transporter permease [Holophaga sp.]|nr:branched-chain amino acid ABC transporter permease [Holophaga sp.]HPS66766.1 branched-chain amino acid ABC transporter permease [Holophaga sp.]